MAEEQKTEPGDKVPTKKPTIHTMKTDVEELFKTTRPSLIQMIGQSTGKEYVPAASEGRSHVAPTLKLVLVGVGILVLATAAFFLARPWLPGASPTTPTPKPVTPAPFFATETARTISVKASDRNLFLRLVEDSMREREREGTIKRLVVKLRDEAGERFLAFADFAQLYRLSPPLDLLHAIRPPLMPFIYYGKAGSRFGFAVRTSDPDRTLRDLLSWEVSLLREFDPFFFGERPETLLVPFEDRTYRNIDWRYLKLSPDRDIGIGYTIFPVGNIVVITMSKDAMETVINRLFDAR